MQKTFETHCEFPVTVEFDYQPPEKETHNYPGCPEEVNVYNWRIAGVDLDEAVVVDFKPIQKTLAALKLAHATSSMDTMIQLINKLSFDIDQIRFSSPMQYLIQGYLDEIQPGVEEKIMDEIHTDQDYYEGAA